MDGTLTVPVIDFAEMRYCLAAADRLVISNLWFHPPLHGANFAGGDVES